MSKQNWIYFLKICLSTKDAKKVVSPMAHDELVVWQDFGLSHALSDDQIQKFKLFYHELISYNELFNLTRITDLNECITYHFEDSLVIQNAVDMKSITTIVDIGSGAGFPGIPLALVYAHLRVVLIEVTHKKIQFLETMRQKLDLKNIEVYPLDWRTFLRKTHYDVHLFCSRASLQPQELMRMFKPSCPYRNASLVYWASDKWNADPSEMPFVKKEYPYQVGRKHRKLIFFGSGN